MGAIADMVAEMLAIGVPAETIVMAVRACEECIRLGQDYATARSGSAEIKQVPPTATRGGSAPSKGAMRMRRMRERASQAASQASHRTSLVTPSVTACDALSNISSLPISSLSSLENMEESKQEKKESISLTPSLSVTERDVTRDAVTVTPFDEYWQPYPRKVGKLGTKKAYERTIKNKLATHEELVAGAKNYAAECAGRDRRYIKHPVKWLNEGCWSDEPISVVSTTAVVADGLFIQPDSPEFESWTRHRNGRPPVVGQKGAWVKTQWPPGLLGAADRQVEQARARARLFDSADAGIVQIDIEAGTNITADHTVEAIAIFDEPSNVISPPPLIPLALTEEPAPATPTPVTEATNTTSPPLLEAIPVSEALRQIIGRTSPRRRVPDGQMPTISDALRRQILGRTANTGRDIVPLVPLPDGQIRPNPAP